MDDYIISFPDKYTAEIDATERMIKVQFITPENKKARFFELKGDISTVGPLTALGKELIKHIGPVDKFRTKALVDKEFEECIIEISELVEEIIIAKNEAAGIEERAKEMENEMYIDDGYQIIDEMKHPLLCVAWIIDWITAGEKANILYSWLAYASQVVLKNPISVIGIGEGGSGKTHIQEVALSLIPSQYIVTVKSMTDAALYGYCDTDPYFFDGKVVNIGDMGGKNDHDEAQNFKNAMKEMQSDGYMARNKQVPKMDGGYENKLYELFGYPCLSYTNVPGFEFEDQEKSRSIFYQPRVDNDEAVMIFKTLSRMKGTKTTVILEEKRAKVEDIKRMVLALRDRMDKVNIYNPYNQFIKDFLGSSKYFKRDVDKYDGILRVITAVNGYKRPLVNDTLLTTKEDISIFVDILARYHESITSNLTPGAVEVLQELRDNADKWDLYEPIADDGGPGGITIGDYQHRSMTKFHKTTLGNYFRELNAEGLVKTTGKEGQSNLYILVDTQVKVDKDEIELSESDKKMLEFNFGMEAYDVLSTYTSPLDIFMEQPTAPYWNDFLPENKS